jgi:hypothetical protein
MSTNTQPSFDNNCLLAVCTPIPLAVQPRDPPTYSLRSVAQPLVRLVGRSDYETRVSAIRPEYSLV